MVTGISMNDGEKQAYSVVGFCKAHEISRGLFYLQHKQGLGPKLMKIGRRTLISAEAAREWRRRMESLYEKAS